MFAHTPHRVFSHVPFGRLKNPKRPARRHEPLRRSVDILSVVGHPRTWVSLQHETLPKSRGFANWPSGSMGYINSKDGQSRPGRKKNKILTQPKIYETYDQRVVISVLCHCYVHELQTVGTPPDVARRILGDLHKFLHTHSYS